MVITGAAYFADKKWGLGLESALGFDYINLLAIEAVATIGLVAPGVLGAGYQTVEGHSKMVAEKKEVKKAKKQAKVEGKVISPEKKADKLAKKLHITSSAALQIVQEQQKGRQEALAKKQEVTETLLVEKLAKKLGISKEQAKVIREEQIKNK